MGIFLTFTTLRSFVKAIEHPKSRLVQWFVLQFYLLSG